MLGSADNPNRAGLPSRAELAARYAERTGFDLTHLRYYEVLSLFKLGCIMEGHYANTVSAGRPDRRPLHRACRSRSSATPAHRQR